MRLQLSLLLLLLLLLMLGVVLSTPSSDLLLEKHLAPAAASTQAVKQLLALPSLQQLLLILHIAAHCVSQKSSAGLKIRT